MKITNGMSLIYPNYADTPKAVVAAVAFSIALRLCEDDHAAAQKMLSEEWEALHDSGIVQQKPRN